MNYSFHLGWMREDRGVGMNGFGTVASSLIVSTRLIRNDAVTIENDSEVLKLG